MGDAGFTCPPGGDYSLQGIAATDPIEALLDGRKALVDPRLKLVDIGEDIRPVVFNSLAEQLTNIER